MVIEHVVRKDMSDKFIIEEIWNIEHIFCDKFLLVWRDCNSEYFLVYIYGELDNSFYTN